MEQLRLVDRTPGVSPFACRRHTLLVLAWRTDVEWEGLLGGGLLGLGVLGLFFEGFTEKILHLKRGETG